MPDPIKEEVQSRSFSEEICHDKKITRSYIEGARESTSPMLRSVAGIYQRVLHIVQKGGLEITPQDGDTRSASENALPACSYLSHGSRILIELPETSGDSVMNWISSGRTGRRGIFDSYEPSTDPENPVYRRRAATHDVEFQEQGLVEKKGFSIGAIDYLISLVPGLTTKHYGVDLGLDDTTKDPDGECGHLYMHYTPPANGKKGAILLGVEGSAPRSSKHSKTGASDPYSAMKGSIMEDLSRKRESSTDYPSTLIPKKYGGMRITLDQDKIAIITSGESWKSCLGDKIPSTEIVHQDKLESTIDTRTPTGSEITTEHLAIRSAVEKSSSSSKGEAASTSATSVEMTKVSKSGSLSL